jgi:hypothetical protein
VYFEALHTYHDTISSQSLHVAGIVEYDRQRVITLGFFFFTAAVVVKKQRVLARKKKKGRLTHINTIPPRRYLHSVINLAHPQLCGWYHGKV